MKSLLLAVVLMIACTTSLFSQTLRIGSIAPQNSPWDDVLRELAAEWREISNGRIQLRIFPGGIAGDEQDMVVKARLGQLDGLVLSSMGLTYIDRDFFAMSLPAVIRDDSELEYLLDKMKETYEKKLEDEGFVLLTWNSAGWIYFFSRNPVYSPDDLKRTRLGVPPAEDVMNHILVELGFRVVPVQTIDVLSSLQSGMADSYYFPPLAAAAFQIFGLANNMLNYPISPVMGGVLLTQRAWRRISDHMKPELIASATRQAQHLYVSNKELEAEAMRIMKANGLVVNTIDSAMEKEWDDLLQEGMKKAVGTMISTDIYDEIMDHLEHYRKTNDSR